MENTNSVYSIEHLVLFTGLTDRTIRNYISSGILQGEKVNGVWRFTPEQTETFICHPTVRPSILAKQNSAVYDFLADRAKTDCEICMILDAPGRSRREIVEYFCRRISSGDFAQVHFSYDGVAKVPRVILKGTAAEVMRLAGDFLQE